jgi:mono/diheme cytochrome c family protein
VVVVGLATTVGVGLFSAGARSGELSKADVSNRAQVALGADVYARRCANCHGARLEGQPNWRESLPDGRRRAPPHDETGHTWHHADRYLFDLIKGNVQRFAPPGQESDMPAFKGVLTDEEIWAVIAFIKSRWPESIRKRHDRMNEVSQQ